VIQYINSFLYTDRDVNPLLSFAAVQLPPRRAREQRGRVSTQSGQATAVSLVGPGISSGTHRTGFNKTFFFLWKKPRVVKVVTAPHAELPHSIPSVGQ
jgi:hypothetical protein